MRDLNGKVAWITGAGTGIGEGSALALAGAGMKVVLSGRRAAELERVAAAITARGGHARVAPLDVSDAAAVQAVVDGFEREEGRLDVAVTCAGLNVRRRNWKHPVRTDWAQVILTALSAPFSCSNRRIRRFATRSSSDSASVVPDRSPASTAAFFIHPDNVIGWIPKSAAICSSVTPSGRLLATFTTSSRNSCG